MKVLALLIVGFTLPSHGTEKEFEDNPVINRNTILEKEEFHPWQRLPWEIQEKILWHFQDMTMRKTGYNPIVFTKNICELSRVNSLTKILAEEVGKTLHTLRFIEMYPKTSKLVTDQKLAKLLTMCPKIKNLYLYKCSALTDKGLGPIGKLEYLTSLELDGCIEVTGNGLKNISRLTKLSRLDLSFCQGVKNEDLSHILPLVNLKILDLTGCKKITKGGIKLLSPLADLQIVRPWFLLNDPQLLAFFQLGTPLTPNLEDIYDIYEPLEEIPNQQNGQPPPPQPWSIKDALASAFSTFISKHFPTFGDW